MFTHLPDSWKVVEFGSILDGGTRNGIYKPQQFRGSGYKMVNMGELFAYPRLRDVPMSRIQLTDEEAQRFGLRVGDLLFARRSLVAEGAGKCSIVYEVKEPLTFESSIIRARPKSKIADSLFLYYLFNSPLGSHLLDTILRQVAVAGITGTDLVKLKIPLPPLPEQRAIAGILGALDDKIELNRRMNRTLESMARAVFRRWFVESEEVAGWEVGKLGDIAENARRSANADEMDPETYYIGLEHMPRRSISLSEWGNASELASNKFIFKEGEFLFGKLRPYFHKVGIAPIDGVCSTDILVIVPKSPEWYSFVLGHISSVELINYTNAASTGTKMPRTSWSDIANYEVATPPVELVTEFNEMFLPLVQKIRANIMQSRTLASLRDSLLPKLMRGEVRVKDEGEKS